MTASISGTSFVGLSTSDITDYVSRLGAFVSADIAANQRPDDREARLALQDSAGRVRPDCTQQQTIANLARLLMKRAYSQIYEDYAARMVNEIERTARSMDPLVADALRVHCGVAQLREDAKGRAAAVREAYHSLYGADADHI
ncbi:hypothetical protein VI03_25535 [Burkholderia vietnamiensis]|uniref:hypothetical protein n=1 Tax=Burkholderia vietnamiensis TaxID=60552 RepID=UPI000621F190|nr:hypothetical protein [Burkholderia vietnamiensis]KKI36135.1 hypothetical protein VI03_25535 [Burkholderia vietnamiensis]